MIKLFQKHKNEHHVELANLKKIYYSYKVDKPDSKFVVLDFGDYLVEIEQSKIHPCVIVLP